MIRDDDIIKDILLRTMEVARNGLSITEAVAQQIERDIRVDWGGCELYIQHKMDRRRMEERNENICAQYWDGDTKDLNQLAARWGLSVKHLRRIIGL